MLNPRVEPKFRVIWTLIDGNWTTPHLRRCSERTNTSLT
jgi:hypothetical protein